MLRRILLLSLVPPLAGACAPTRLPAAPAAAPCPAPPPPAGKPTPAPAPAPAAYSGHGAESVPPEVLAKYAAAPLPGEVSRKIQMMLDVRAPGGGILSPDAKRLVFTWAVTGTVQVWRLDGPQRFPVQMTGGEDPTRIAAITPDGKWLVLSRDRKGEEYPGLYLQSADGGALEVIQHKPKVQTVLAFVSDDGKALYYRANDIKPDSQAIYRFDLATKQRELVFDTEGLWDVADHRPDGTMLLVRNVGSQWQEYYELDPARKKLSPLFGQNEKEEYRARYGAAPGEVLVLTRKLGEFRRLYRWAAATGFSPITAEQKHDVESFVVDDARRHILVETNEDGYTRLSAFDARSLKPQKLPPLPPAEHTTIGYASRDGKYATITTSTSKAPATSYVLEWATGKLTEWQLPSAPEIDTSRFVAATLETYPARDGTKIPMFVRRPEACAAAAEPCPVIVSFHGGPEGQSRPGLNGRAQLFVEAGFVWVEPNVRGSEGYGKAWAHADDGAKRLAVVTDIEDAASYIRTAWAKGGKAPKIGIYGGSYGGYSTLMGMTMFAGAYDAGASIVGISSLVTFLENTAPYRRALRASEYGDLDKDRAALVKLSPITYVDRVKAPLLLVQGATDPRVPVGEAMQIHDALDARNVPNRLIVFPDEGHGMQRRENRVLEIGHALKFFEEHLKR